MLNLSYQTYYFYLRVFYCSENPTNCIQPLPNTAFIISFEANLLHKSAELPASQIGLAFKMFAKPAYSKASFNVSLITPVFLPLPLLWWASLSQSIRHTPYHV